MESADFDDYESLPDDVGIGTHMMAGAIAGVLEHCLVYPVDSLKTKMQTVNPLAIQRFTGLWSTVKTVYNTTGIFSTYRGVNVVALGAGPAHALYFSTYEGMKSILKPYTGQDDTHFLVASLSGITATIVHDGFMNPFDVVKQRLQMYGSPYSGVRDAVQSSYAKEGIRAFYRSYGIQLCMNIPYTAFHFWAYENLKGRMHEYNTSNRIKKRNESRNNINMYNEDDVLQDKSTTTTTSSNKNEYYQTDEELNKQYNLSTHLIAGAGAGGTAALFTTPMDVIKTALNTQEQTTSVLNCSNINTVSSTNINHSSNNTIQSRVYLNSIRSAVTTIYNAKGLRGFASGAQARVLFHIPSTAISWSVYEFFKHSLSKDARVDDVAVI